jgi:uncharacterized protein
MERPAPETDLDSAPLVLPWWKSFILGLAAGSGGSLIGVGGGIIMVPFLTMWGMGQKKAQGTSMVVMTAFVPITLFIYSSLGNIDFPFAIPLAVGGVIGGIFGASLCQRYSNQVLGKMFSILLILVALRMLFMPQVQGGATVHVSTFLQYFESLIIGLFAGTMAGFFGVGGGIVFVPAGVLLAGLPQVIAQGSSFTAMLPTSLAGSLTYWKKRSIEWQLLKWIIPGAWIGTFGGSYAADLIPGRILQIIFAIFLIYIGVRKLVTKHSDISKNADSGRK